MFSLLLNFILQKPRKPHARSKTFPLHSNPVGKANVDQKKHYLFISLGDLTTFYPVLATVQLSVAADASVEARPVLDNNEGLTEYHHLHAGRPGEPHIHPLDRQQPFIMLDHLPIPQASSSLT